MTLRNRSYGRTHRVRRFQMVRSFVFFAVSVLAVRLMVPVATAAPAIEWRVENPFRMFTKASDTEVHRATFEALSPAERRTAVLSAERQLARRHKDGWAATLLGAVCWDANRNRHVCPGTDEAKASTYIKPTHHVVRARVAGIDDAEVSCTWLTAPLGRSRLRGEAVTAPCRQDVKLSISFPTGATVTVEVGGRRVAEARIVVEDLFIVGMGDSFGSGEGNPDVPVRFSRERAADYGKLAKGVFLTGYPARVGDWRSIGDDAFIEANARWLDQACHRSLYSHQLRAALQIAVEDPHRAVTFAGFACSGAEVTAGLFLRYKGNEWVPHPPDLSQISAIAEEQCAGVGARAHELPEAYHINGQIPDLQGGLVLRKCEVEDARKIDLLLVSIGGNDIGFSRLVANAVLRDKSTLKRLGGWFGQVFPAAQANAQIANLAARYKSLNRAFHYILHLPWDENDRVILTAYPGMSLLDDGKTVCPSGQAGMDVLPAFELSQRRAREGEEAARRLNSEMAKAARAYGWTFVDAHRADFQGRGICAGFAAAAFSTADDLRLPRFVDNRWVPYNPADYRAYVSRQRWFRTPNDAFMTGNFHVAGSLLLSVLKNQNLTWTQVLLAATYSGAFHPTAEGQAAIADAVATRARGVIEKYAGRNRIK
ncbi:MAG: hypothetical protein R3D27_00210 [Hyphomicrobiaceae bacterium]